MAVLARFERSKDQADLEWAVLLHAQALRFRPPGHVDRLVSLRDLANDLWLRFNQLGHPDDIDRAVLLYSQALECDPSDDALYLGLLRNLADAIWERFRKFGHPADLDRAAALFKIAVEHHTPDYPGYSSLLNDFGTVILTQFQKVGDPALLNRAVRILESALKLRPPGHPQHSVSLNNLASAVWTRFGLLGDLGDLDNAASLFERALKLHPHTHPQHSSSLNNLSIAILKRYQRSGERADLDKSVQLSEQALKLRLPGHPERTSSLNNFGSAVFTRFEQTGDREDLDKAIMTFEELFNLHPPGHFHHSTSLNNLASTISTRSRLSGNRADLDRAVLLFEQALNLHQPGHVDRAMSLLNLGVSVLRRFEHSGGRGDLDRAVHLFELALELRPPGHADRSRPLINLSSATSRQFELTKDPTDLDRAINLHEQALELHPPGHPYRSTSLGNLANAISMRFRLFGNCEDVDRVIKLCQQTLELLERRHPGYSRSLITLSDTILRRSELLKDREDLAEALRYCRHGLHTELPADIDRSDLLSALGRVYTAQARSSGLDTHIALALDAFSKGAQADSSPVSSRLNAAEQWLSMAIVFLQNESAIAACQVLITLLPQLLWLELDLPSRLATLTRAKELVCTGAACAIRQPQLETAIELLEGGRGSFWFHIFQLRESHVNPPPSFAQKLIDLAHELRAASLEDPSLKKPHSAERLAAENVRRRDLVTQWSQTLEQIHEMKGYERFLLPRLFDELAAAAKHGPIVILNASSLGCDAVVIRSSQMMPPERVALPNITYERLQQLRAALKGNIGRDAARFMELVFEEPDLSLREILEELWTSVAKPIVESLGLKRSENPEERVWWCPTNLFTFMPIHAAGIYHTRDTLSVADYAISSYIPTLDALITARSHAVMPKTDKILLVIQPKTPGLKPLPYTVNECKCVQKVVPPQALLHLNDPNDPQSSQPALDGSNARVENVLAELPDASIVHFACHGTQDKDPLKSALHLWDGPLTIDRLINKDLPNASIAFLSACHSAAGDQKQPDETIHLGAAMLAVGYRSVIATMWSMEDRDGPVIAEEVYSRLFNPRPDPRRAAHALHAAVRKLRNKGADLVSWVPFIHLGV